LYGPGEANIIEELQNLKKDICRTKWLSLATNQIQGLGKLLTFSLEGAGDWTRRLAAFPAFVTHCLSHPLPWAEFISTHFPGPRS
jgi:hypothetical protein